MATTDQPGRPHQPAQPAGPGQPHQPAQPGQPGQPGGGDEASPTPLVRLLHRPRGYATGPHVLAELRRVIASGHVDPGTAIPLDEVAAFFGLSRIPVREAAKTLLGEGLLEHEPRLGYTVTRLSDAELAELYTVAGALESAGLAAAVAAATPADDDRLRALHAALDESALADAAVFARLSREFHDAMLAPSRMPRLLHMLHSAWNITEPTRAMSRVGAPARRLLRDDHSRMLAAFVARDTDRLLALAAEHTHRLEAGLGTPTP